MKPVATEPPHLRPLAARTIRRGQIPWGVVLAISSSLSLAALVYYYFYQRGVAAERHRILRERAALSTEIAGEYGTLRAKIEPWTVAAAREPYAGDSVDREARTTSWRDRPTIYVRVRAVDASSEGAVHKASKLASLDGLSSCLLRGKSGGPWAYGEVVSRLEMLGGAFVADVRETQNDLRLRNLAYALSVYHDKDWPPARDAVVHAEQLVVAIDEDPPLIPEKSSAFGDAATVSDRIASVPHPIRVVVRRLGDGRELVRLRRTPEAGVVQVQGDALATSGGVEVRRAQALGCAMAGEVLEATSGVGAPKMAAAAAPLPAVAPVVPPAPIASGNTAGSAAGPAVGSSSTTAAPRARSSATGAAQK